MTVRHDFTYNDGWVKGEDQPFTIAVVDVAGAPVNMANWALKFVLSTSPAATALITKTPSIVNVNGANDGASFTLVAADSAALTPGIYAYALWRIDSGVKEDLVHGDLPLGEAVAAT